MKLLPLLVCGTFAVILSATPVLAQNEDVAPTEPIPTDTAPDDEAPAPRPGAPTPNGRPPLIGFDEATARDYLARIDEARNAMSLQMGLFMGRRSALEPEQSLNLITEQIAKETPGSRRWALLQSLVGFAGFHAPGLNPEANFAYQLLFTTPLDEEADPVLESTLQTYLSSVASTGMRRGDNSSTPEVMLVALRAYLSLPPDTAKTLGAANPDGGANATTGANTARPVPRRVVDRSLQWGGASRNTGAGPVLAKEIETRLEGPDLTGAARLRVLRVGAEVNESIDAERAVELIQEAAPLAAQFAPNDTSFTDLQVRLLAANGKLPEAITAQKAFITRTGIGRANLLALLARSGDTGGLKVTVEELKAANADVGEIQAAVAALARLKGVEGIDGPQLARELAESYLNSPRERTPEAELSMKMNLARLLYQSGDKQGAIKLLEGVTVRKDANAATRRSQRAVATMLEQMQNGTYSAD